jgi:hypothetical protein
MVTRLSALFGALTIALGSASCTAQRRSEEDVAPEVRFEQVAFQVFRGPELTASGTADAARLRRDTNELNFEAIRIKFPAAADREEALVTAARGRGNLADRWFVAEGGIVAVQGDDRAETADARFSAEDKLVTGESPVVVSGPGYRLTGPGFVLDPRAGTVRVDGGAAIRAGEATR